MGVLFLLFFPLKAFLYLIIWFYRRIVSKPRRNLAGEIVLITGAANGIGKAASLKFASLGCTVVAWDVDNDGLKRLKQELGKEHHAYFCDIADRKSVYATAEKVRRDVGDVSILVNNAGVVSARYLLDCPDEHIETTMKVNTMAHFWTCKAFLPSMMAKNHGHVVAVSSIAGHIGSTKLTDYCASKFAIIGMMESLRCELANQRSDGINLTVVSPVAIDTKGPLSIFSPVLSLERVADELVTAVQRDEYLVLLPRYMKGLLILKNILPYNVVAFLQSICGVKGGDD
eukprot:m.48550 g.48550  ORF g.48550 m.48550 type:complete len:286 (+) comp33887_c0_seq4:54-911(+)